MLELDKIFNKYFSEKYDSESLELQEKFVSLLTESDTDLYSWLLGSVNPPLEYVDIVKSIQNT